MKVRPTSRSIFEELTRSATREPKPVVLETRGSHLVTSAANFIEALNEVFEPEQAEVLTKRFISSIRAGDPNRFVRQLRKIEQEKKPK